MIDSQSELGSRIALARENASMTQTDLAARLAIDRTALSKIEAGTRKVSATELFAIAEALDQPIDWFVAESAPSVLSRREDSAVGGRAEALDNRVERLARDISFLVTEGVLDTRSRSALPTPRDEWDTERLARETREAMGVPAGPLTDLQSAVEGIDLLAFSLALGEEGGDAAYVEVEGWGVALINGSLQPGRRRFSLAHELGHHMIGDAYSPDVEIRGDRDIESLLNSFAVHLLMPRNDVIDHWNELAEGDQRLAAVAIASRFRVSWKSVCSHLFNMELIDEIDRRALEDAPPTAGDAIELGERWVEELVPPSIPTEYGKRVLRAYRGSVLTLSRTIELLHGTADEGELPSRFGIPFDSWRREFDPLS